MKNGDEYANINGTCTVRFGYMNPGTDTVIIPHGPNNNITATGSNTVLSYNQITTFYPGVHDDAVLVTYSCPFGYQGAIWHLENIQTFVNGI